jgi:hypothetical protein
LFVIPQRSGGICFSISTVVRSTSLFLLPGTPRL